MSAATTHSASPRPLCILVVESNDDLAGIMVDLLRSAGEHDIAVAKCAAEGISHLRRRPYDVILAGGRLAGATGFEMIDQARAEGLVAETTVVVIASGDHSLRREVRARGATFLPKPWWPDQLLAALRGPRGHGKSGASFAPTSRGR